jgi:hypothetical protein
MRPRQGEAIAVSLGPKQARAIERMAKAKGLSREELIRDWVLQKLTRRTH